MASINKKAQGGLFLLFTYILVGVFYFTAGVGVVTQLTTTAITESGLTGLLAWFFTYLNLWLTIGYIVGFIALARWIN